MDVYEVSEKVQIIKWYYSGHPMRTIKRLFEDTFENRSAPSLSTLNRIIKNFEISGCVAPSSHKKRPVCQNSEREMNEIMVLAALNKNPTIPTKTLAEEMNRSKSTVRRILKKNGYQFCKGRKTQRILPEQDIKKIYKLKMEETNDNSTDSNYSNENNSVSQEDQTDEFVDQIIKHEIKEEELDIPEYV